ncbi:MAG TPA: type II CAAX endopeptidase family protein [Acidimicrobiia bacterium]|nr:type II CAAX endopeptidase family protein [Acidimicrobiia bacterium]
MRLGSFTRGWRATVNRRRSALTFFGLVFGWSWLWWLAAGLTGVPVTEPPATTLALIGGLGPLLAAVLLVWRHYQPEERHEFWRRIWDPVRVGWRWWLLIVLAGAGPTLIGWLVTSGGDLGIGVSSTAAASVGVFIWLVFAAGAALVEEPGWRGYALDALLKRHSLAVSSVALGVVWALWHLPQFFLEGTYQHDEVGFATGLFWMFMAAIIVQTFLYVWVVTSTSGSILAAIVFHALTNLAGELFDPDPGSRLVALIIWVAMAVGLGFYWRRRPNRSSPHPLKASRGVPV